MDTGVNTAEEGYEERAAAALQDKTSRRAQVQEQCYDGGEEPGVVTLAS